jgi:hypothetical protein
MSNAQHAENKTEAAKPGAPPAKKIHRVCIGCNYMFEVTLENFTAKHCLKCHKG